MDDECVIGDWIRQKILGCGSFGIVSLWRNINSKEELAIKMCKWGDEQLLTPKHKERWTKEVEMMNIMDSNNIVGTRSLCPKLLAGLAPQNLSRLPILCMEYCGRGDLRQQLNCPDFSSGLPEIEVRCILEDMKNAVSYLHQLKITHRDLKPENIVLQVVPGSEPGVGRNVIYKLIDLGYSKEIDSNSVCASFVGTLQYLAPELFYSKSYSNTVDYWSFGLLAYEVVCGVRPFLPHMPPVQWMTHVKNKTPQDICALENLNGEIEFSSSIAKENRISERFKECLETWLRSALEWDPKKRGHSSTEEKSVKFSLPDDPSSGNYSTVESSKNNTIEIFSLLEKILAKKILVIFSVPTYDHLSYEIDEMMTFPILQEWIERDTKVSVERQVLLTPESGTQVKCGNPVSNYWHDRCTVMLYLLQKDCMVGDNIKPKLPDRLRYCLANPKLEVSYFHILDVFANTLYYTWKEKELYESLVKAYVLRVEHLKSEIGKLYNDHNESEKSMCKLNEKNDLISVIVELNNKKVAESDDVNRSSYAREYKTWFTKCKFTADKIDKLKEAWSQLSTRLQSVARRCNEINEKDVLSQLNVEELTDLHKIAQKLYVQVRKVPMENRGKKPYLNAVKIIYKSLKLRDSALGNIKTQKISQKIIDIHVETEKMSSLIISAGTKAEELSKDLTNILVEKENMMWNSLESSGFVYSDVETLPLTLPNTQEIQNGQSSITSFRIGDAVRNPGKYIPPRDKMELESLVNDNMTLRLTSQDALAKSYQKHKTIQQDLIYDFSFLDSA